jgi:hypothetical protein
MADEAKRMGEEVQGQAQRFGREYQEAAATGIEAASRSLTEANKGFQALSVLRFATIQGRDCPMFAPVPLVRYSKGGEFLSPPPSLPIVRAFLSGCK